MAESEYKWRLRKYDEGRRERAREAQGLRDAAAANVPSGWGADSVEANTPSAPGRSFGFRSGAAALAPGAKENLGNLRAVAEAVELGSPASYGGGAGAPEPIGVIRGLRQTYAPQRPPGKQFIEGEYSTSLRAGQAYNRRLGEKAGGGKFDPVEGPNLRLAAELNEKNPLQKAQAEALAGGQLSKLLEDRLLRDYGMSVKGEDGQETLTLPPEIKRLALGYRPKNAEDVESFMQKIAPEGAKIKAVTSWNDPKTGMAMRRQLLATATDPAEQKRIKEEVVTPENLEWFQGLKNRGQQGPPPGQSSLRQPVDGTGAGILDRASLLGKTLSYEMQPSLRKAGTPAPTLESVRNERLTNRQRIWDEEENLRAGAPRAM